MTTRTYGRYIVPDWWFSSPKDVNCDWIAEQEKVVEQCNELNTIQEKVFGKEIDDIKHKIGELYGTSSNMYKHFARKCRSEFEWKPNLDGALNRHKEAYKKKNSEREIKAKKEEKEKKYNKLVEEAIAFCIEHGKMIGVDFTLDDAVGCANTIAFEKIVEERLKEHAEHGVFFDFNGQNCDGPCEGWDGSSRRCQCGNRRVSWDHEGNFQDMYVYGEAY